MKKILFFLAMLPMVIFTSCSDDDDVQTTYTLKYNVESTSSRIETSVWLYEYNEIGEVVKTNTVDDITENYTETFNANENAVKVKAQVRMSGGGIETNRWVQTVFYLETGGSTDISINDKTIVGIKEP